MRKAYGAAQFQFQLGSIKGLPSLVFNVRANMFQFQLGSIKGIAGKMMERRAVSMFQFQLGSIKGLLETAFVWEAVLFQFQLGSIKGRGEPGDAAPERLVSIPAWFY